MTALHVFDEIENRREMCKLTQQTWKTPRLSLSFRYFLFSSFSLFSIFFNLFFFFFNAQAIEDYPSAAVEEEAKFIFYFLLPILLLFF